MRITQQAASALFFLIFGAAYLWAGADLATGTAADMGIGYAPRMLGIGCIGVGAVLMAGAVAGRTGALGEPVSFALKPLVLVTAMTAGFAFLLPWLGLPLTVTATVLAAAISGEDFRPARLVLIAAGLAAGTTLLFAYLLNLQLPIWPVLPGKVA